MTFQNNATLRFALWDVTGQGFPKCGFKKCGFKKRGFKKCGFTKCGFTKSEATSRKTFHVKTTRAYDAPELPGNMENVLVPMEIFTAFNVKRCLASCSRFCKAAFRQAALRQATFPKASFPEAMACDVP